MAMASEITGLRWIVPFRQPCSTEAAARIAEQAVFARYSEHRLVSNGEILKVTDAMTVEIAIAMEMRNANKDG